jgi:hypothetical protein
LAIPVLHDVKKNTFYCKLSDYRESTGTDQVDEIGLIHLESVGLNSFVYLMQVANIYFKLKTDSVFIKTRMFIPFRLITKAITKMNSYSYWSLLNKVKLNMR